MEYRKQMDNRRFFRVEKTEIYMLAKIGGGKVYYGMEKRLSNSKYQKPQKTRARVRQNQEEQWKNYLRGSYDNYHKFPILFSNIPNTRESL